MKLRTFFERVMGAASGPLRWSDVVNAEIAANRSKRPDGGQDSPRNARRARTKKHTRKH